MPICFELKKLFHFVEASSLFHSINTLNGSKEKHHESFVTATLGLSLNKQSLNQEVSYWKWDHWRRKNGGVARRGEHNH